MWLYGGQAVGCGLKQAKNAFFVLPIDCGKGYTVRKIVLKLLLYLYFRTKVLKFRHDILIK